MNPPAPIDEQAGPLSAEGLAAIRAANRPVVIREAAEHWPAVAAGRQGGAATVAYLKQHATQRPVGAIAARPEERGRFFYNEGMTGMNFAKGQGLLPMFLDDLLHAADLADPPAMAVQSEVLANIMPGFVAENRFAPLDHVSPRIWIGNRIIVAPHYDVMENLAVCMAGRRRFTLFPPEQIANLYPGPLEVTPAGTPVSMVDMTAPNLDQFPRFAEAWATARSATLEPGDALYIPYCWWHGVESLEPVSILVNYWWNDAAPQGAGAPYDALLHALLALRPLPPEQRAIWRTFFDYYVHETSGSPAAHLPPHARGVLGAPEPRLFDRMRMLLRQALG